MSKRHTANRRRNYGRRQHELHERIDRRAERRADRAWRLGHEVGIEGLSLDHHAADAPFGYVD